MTVEKALDKIDNWLMPMYMGVGHFARDFLDAVGVLQRNTIKYRWHNLTKDSHDLPKECEQVLIETTDSGTLIAELDNDFSTWVIKGGTWYEMGSQEVLAWRYIEPFSEV